MIISDLAIKKLENDPRYPKGYAEKAMYPGQDSSVAVYEMTFTADGRPVSVIDYVTEYVGSSQSTSASWYTAMLRTFADAIEKHAAPKAA